MQYSNRGKKIIILGKNNSTSGVLFLIVATIIFGVFSIRENYYISDALNYIDHAKKGFDPSSSSDYNYPLYWLLQDAIGFFVEPELAPAALSLVVSALLIVSALKLNNKERWIFLFFCIANAAIFNMTQVALRNGVALGLVLSSLAYGRYLPIAISVMIHPGVAPLIGILFFLEKTAGNLKKTLVVTLALFALLFFLMPYFESLLVDRGYEQGQSRTAGLLTYLVILSLAILFFLSLHSSIYRFFMPMMFALWIFFGINYEFGGRLFLQSLILSTFIVLKEAKSSGYRTLYLCGFFLFTIYGSFVWHPIADYYDGWLGYWAALLA